MRDVVYYVGAPENMAHHARPLADAFDLRIVTADEVGRLAQPADVCIFYNEHLVRFREVCLELIGRGCATLYAIDGILEWRNCWEPAEDPNYCPWAIRPVLSHKAACIGRSQARLFESWGNLGKCEIVGVPRFDRPAGCRSRERSVSDPFRVLVVTAKTPGFNAEQIALTVQSLRDARQWFDEHPRLGATAIEPVWRLTQGLEEQLGISNQLRDTTGSDLAMALANVNAVLTTPSTAMLEGMLHGLPVALLDYNNRPHYVPAAWRITARKQFDQVLPELLQPSPARLLYQDTILHDALECHTPATPRLVELVQRMRQLASDCVSRGQPLTFPRRILRDEQGGHHLPEPRYDQDALFPRAAAIAVAGIDAYPDEMLGECEAGLAAMSGDPAAWKHVAIETAGRLRVESAQRMEIARTQAALQVAHAELEKSHASLQQALHEAQIQITRLKQLQRRTIEARLSRLAAKVGRYTGVSPRKAG